MKTILEYTKELVADLYNLEPTYDIRVQPNKIIVTESEDGYTYTIEMDNELFHVYLDDGGYHYDTTVGSVGQVIGFIWNRGA